MHDNAAATGNAWGTMRMPRVSWASVGDSNLAAAARQSHCSHTLRTSTRQRLAVLPSPGCTLITANVPPTAARMHRPGFTHTTCSPPILLPLHAICSCLAKGVRSEGSSSTCGVVAIAKQRRRQHGKKAAITTHCQTAQLDTGYFDKLLTWRQCYSSPKITPGKSRTFV